MAKTRTNKLLRDALDMLDGNPVEPKHATTRKSSPIPKKSPIIEEPAKETMRDAAKPAPTAGHSPAPSVSGPSVAQEAEKPAERDQPIAVAVPAQEPAAAPEPSVTVPPADKKSEMNSCLTRCDGCGAENPSKFKMCGACGAKLPELKIEAPAVEPPVEVQPEPAAHAAPTESPKPDEPAPCEAESYSVEIREQDQVSLFIPIGRGLGIAVNSVFFGGGEISAALIDTDIGQALSRIGLGSEGEPQAVRVHAQRNTPATESFDISISFSNGAFTVSRTPAGSQPVQKSISVAELSVDDGCETYVSPELRLRALKDDAAPKGVVFAVLQSAGSTIQLSSPQPLQFNPLKNSCDFESDTLRGEVIVGHGNFGKIYSFVVSEAKPEDEKPAGETEPEPAPSPLPDADTAVQDGRTEAGLPPDVAPGSGSPAGGSYSDLFDGVSGEPEAVSGEAAGPDADFEVDIDTERTAPEPGPREGRGAKTQTGFGVPEEQVDGMPERELGGPGEGPREEPPEAPEPPRASRPPEAKPEGAQQQAQAPPQAQPAKAQAPAGFETARKVLVNLPYDPVVEEGNNFQTNLGLGVRMKCVPRVSKGTGGVGLAISVHPNGDSEPVKTIDLVQRRKDGHWCNPADDSTTVVLGDTEHKGKALRWDTFRLALSSEDAEVGTSGIGYQEVRLYAYVQGLPVGYRGGKADSLEAKLVKESKNLSVFSIAAEHAREKSVAVGLVMRTVINERKEQSFELLSLGRGGNVDVTTAMEFAESKAKKRGDANTNVVRIAYGKKELNAVVSREGRELYLYVSGLNNEEKKGAAAVLAPLGAKASSWWAGKKAAASAAWKKRVSEPLARVANIKLKSPDFSVVGKPFAALWRERSRLLATMTVGGLTSVFTYVAASSVSGIAMQGAMAAGGAALLASLTYVIFRWDRKTKR